MKGLLLISIGLTLLYELESIHIQNADSPQRIPGEYLITLQPLRGHRSRASKINYAQMYVENLKGIGNDKVEILNRFVFNRLIIISIRCDDETVLNAISDMPETKTIEANTRSYAMRT